MKKILKKLKSRLPKKMSDESGQGMLEYILLLVVIVGLVLMLKEPLKNQVEGIQGKLKDSVGSILGN
jgi:Flp pilus assembly pilin Flp